MILALPGFLSRIKETKKIATGVNEMGYTWITDMSDFDYKEEEAHRVPRQAKKLVEYFASIIVRTIKRLPMDGRNTGIRCRRRPGRRPCMGAIESEMQPHGNELR